MLMHQLAHTCKMTAASGCVASVRFQTYMHTYIHTYLCTYIHTCINRHTHIHINSIQTFTHIHPTVHKSHTCIAYAHTYHSLQHNARIHKHKHSHTYIHTYIHTYTHPHLPFPQRTHMHVHPSAIPPSRSRLRSPRSVASRRLSRR